MAVKDPIRVRMYNVGFGDCFLILFPATDRAHSMLIDCGVHTASKGAFGIKEVVGKLIDDLTDETGQARIDVVVMSHRHQDHVKGFEDPRWNDVEVGEVWMPWTEDPSDAEARSLLERQSGGAKRLATLAVEGSAARALAVNSLTNERAMGTLHSGFAGHPERRFFSAASAGDGPAFPAIETALLPDVSVRVLGPTRDERVIRSMNPPQAERYVALDVGDLAMVGEELPFARWRVDQGTWRTKALYQHLDISHLGNVVKAGREDPEAMAIALEQSVNNTSLMLLVTMGQASLFFPGDAQWGSWDRILDDEEGVRLLGQTNFYKIGHHGSHNATPRSFVEAVLGPSSAMVSVAPTAIPSWSEIPRQPLLDAVRSTERADQQINRLVVASDELDAVQDGVRVEAGGMVKEVSVAR